MLLSHETCESEWHIEPKFDWRKRDKKELWKIQSKYLVTIPVDVTIACAVLGTVVFVDNIFED